MCSHSSKVNNGKGRIVCAICGQDFGPVNLSPTSTPDAAALREALHEQISLAIAMPLLAIQDDVGYQVRQEIHSGITKVLANFGLSTPAPQVVEFINTLNKIYE